MHRQAVIWSKIKRNIIRNHASKINVVIGGITLKKIRIAFVCMLCFILFLATGCSDTVKIDLSSLGKEDVNNIPLDYKNVLSYTAFVDGNIVYLNADELTATYYKYSIVDGSTIELGTIDNFYLSAKNSVLIKDKLYLFASVIENDDTINALCQIDLTNNTITQYSNADRSLAGISAYEYDGNIVTLKNKVSGNVITTFLETFDISTNEWSIETTNSFNTDTNIGSAIYALYGNQNTLCVLHDECSGKDNIHTTLKFYDGTFKEIKSVELSQDIKDFIMGSRIIEIAAFGDYIYLNNISNKAVLGEIVGNELVPKLMEANLELALNQTDTKNPLFYIRRSNRCFLLDSTGELVSVDLNIKNDYSIMCILSDGNSIVLICYADDKPDCIYQINMDSLKSVVIQ